MRKLLLLLSVVFCSLGAVAQITTGGVQWNMTQPADNIVSIWWRYEVTESEYANVTYKLYRIEYTGQDYATRSEVLVREMSAIQTLNNETIVIKEFENRLVDLDLTGKTKYQFKFVVENKTEKIEVPVYLAGDNADTKYQFTYGLKWGTPAKTNEKSSSVTLHWQSHPQAAVYMVFGVDHEKALATTDLLQATITNLELGAHNFVVRALDAEGNYLATTSPVEYTAVQVDCVTFPTVSAENNTITLTILGYDNDGPFSTNASDYKLTNDDETVTCNSISDSRFTFNFVSLDYTKEFKLETTKTGGVKAIGLFKLNADGSLLEQYCDIVFDLNVTRITQETATLEWNNPGFAPTKAYLTVKKKTGEPVVENKEINPKIEIYAMDGLESGVDYVFELKLTDGYNQSKATAEAKTKVASICEVYETQAGSTVAGCGDGTFLVEYDLEFYTEYENGKPYIMVRFKPLSSEQINSVDLFYTTDSNILSFLNSLKTVSMTLNAKTGWYETRLDKFDKILGSDVALEDGSSVYFTVRAKPNKSCYWLYNYYHTKAVSYKVGTGCQDDTAVKTLSFTKLYPEQTQFTLQCNGRLASVGVFPNANYNESERLFYNSFDDAPSHFTLDITDYAPGTYYLHIHDVYGEANSDSFKCIWAIY
jgi:hypothetical protein